MLILTGLFCGEEVGMEGSGVVSQCGAVAASMLGGKSEAVFTTVLDNVRGETTGLSTPRKIHVRSGDFSSLVRLYWR